MKHSLESKAALFGIALGLSISTLNAAEPWTPSQADLDTAVANAAQQWGINIPVTITLDPAHTCGVYNAARRKNKKDQDGLTNFDDVGAITEHNKTKGITTTTISFAAGDVDDGSEPVRLSDDKVLTQTFVSAPSEKTTHHMRINAACEWSPEFLSQIVLHEYGHIIGIQKHSRNDRSIMYWMVFRPDAAKKYGYQAITEQDRATVPLHEILFSVANTNGRPTARE